MTVVAAEKQAEVKILECDERCDTLSRELKTFARYGSPEAQMLLGLAYRTGEIFGEIDPVKAWKWMKRSRNQHYPPALFQISKWYRYGYESKTDLVLADKYLESAVNKEFAPAILEKGILQYKSDNKQEGEKLIRQAADMGYPKANQLLNSMFNPTTTVADASDSSMVEQQESENNNLMREPTDPEEEVLTVLGTKMEPIQLFEFVISDINSQQRYNRKSTTGSRLGDLKCGDPGSGCTVTKISGIPGLD